MGVRSRFFFPLNTVSAAGHDGISLAIMKHFLPRIKLIAIYNAWGIHTLATLANGNVSNKKFG
jgi:hypothetical protein